MNTDGLSDPVETVFAMFVGLLRIGSTPEQARIQMQAVMPDPAIIEAGINRYEEIASGIIRARDPEAFVNRERLVPWYTGARPGDVFWPSLLDELRRDGFDDAASNSVDLASTKVVSLLPPPWRAEFSGRGLVLGYVQSGKTSNFTAVISKAADAGYRMFVVLSGLHNNLRRQTQIRLDHQLVNLNRSQWVELTTETRDFGVPGNTDALLCQNELRILAVVKKNKFRLLNLINWLASASESALRNCPILVIDDEADQASVNAKDADNRSVLNGLVLRLLSQPKVAYVGYTATPFANIFVDPSIPEDLYPHDFIVDLPRPVGYFGPEKIFGRQPLTEGEADEPFDGLDMIRIVEGDEIRRLRPPRKKMDRADWTPALTSTLRDALRYFLLATAAREGKGPRRQTLVDADTHDPVRHASREVSGPSRPRDRSTPHRNGIRLPPD